jgi:hypothetical protein
MRLRILSRVSSGFQPSRPPRGGCPVATLHILVAGHPARRGVENED